MMDHTLGSGEGENLKTIQHQKYLFEINKIFSFISSDLEPDNGVT